MSVPDREAVREALALWRSILKEHPGSDLAYYTVLDAAEAWLEQGSAIPRYAMLDVWLALGGDGQTFEAWMEERTSADAWAQLLAAIRGDLMLGDTNPEPGAILALVWKRWPEQGNAGENQ